MHSRRACARREAAERELEEVVGTKQLGGTGVERDERRDDAERAACNVEVGLAGELGGAETHEGEGEEEEQGDEGDVLAEGAEAVRMS